MSFIQNSTQNSSNDNKKLARIEANWHIPASIVSTRTINPIRDVIFNMKVTPNPKKEYISLALGKLFFYLSKQDTYTYVFFNRIFGLIGDPTHYGNLKVPENCIDAVITQLKSYKAN